LVDGLTATAVELLALDLNVVKISAAEVEVGVGGGGALKEVFKKKLAIIVIKAKL
jgi:hypothetical protein